MDWGGIYELRKKSGIMKKLVAIQARKNSQKILAREILARRGEILFSRAIILCEGMTEEQIIPAMFEVNFNGESIFNLGISCVSVGGKRYSPFVQMAHSFGIPVFIISENDDHTKTELDRQLQNLKNKGFSFTKDNFGISYCSDGNDFEAELVNVMNMCDEINESLFRFKTNAENNAKYKIQKKTEIKALSNECILKCIQNSKTSYSGFLAEIIRENPYDKRKQDLILPAASEAFEKIKEWLAK